MGRKKKTEEPKKEPEVKWHKGSPPSIGWWPASCAGNIKAIRWWDGKRWSITASPENTAKEAEHISKTKDFLDENIRWAKRWWK